MSISTEPARSAAVDTPEHGISWRIQSACKVGAASAVPVQKKSLRGRKYEREGGGESAKVAKASGLKARAHAESSKKKKKRGG